MRYAFMVTHPCLSESELESLAELQEGSIRRLVYLLSTNRQAYDSFMYHINILNATGRFLKPNASGPEDPPPVKVRIIKDMPAFDIQAGQVLEKPYFVAVALVNDRVAEFVE